jgi:hypothetical protein
MEGCEHYASGGEIEQNRQFHHDPGLAAEAAVAHHGLHHLLTKTGHSRSPDRLKPLHEHMDAHRKGIQALHDSAHGMFGDKPHEMTKAEKEAFYAEADALGKHLESVRLNPASAMEVGGGIGEHAPEHAAMIAAKQAMASNYFDAIRPQPIAPSSPLEPQMGPDKTTLQAYQRQLGIANNPLSVLGHARRGTLLPDDMKTVQTLYPKLAQGLAAKATEGLIEAKSKGAKLSARHMQGLSELLGQPMDSLDSQPMLAAIQFANMPKVGESQGMPQGKGKKSGATAETQKTMKRVDDLYQTPLERLQTGK